MIGVEPAGRLDRKVQAVVTDLAGRADGLGLGCLGLLAGFGEELERVGSLSPLSGWPSLRCQAAAVHKSRVDMALRAPRLNAAQSSKSGGAGNSHDGDSRARRESWPGHPWATRTGRDGASEAATGQDDQDVTK
jgi:hypothetical protein